MRLTIAATLLLSTLGLSACSNNPHNDLAPVCDEQSAWATQGTVDGRYISITCP